MEGVLIRISTESYTGVVSGVDVFNLDVSTRDGQRDGTGRNTMVTSNTAISKIMSNKVYVYYH